MNSDGSGTHYHAQRAVELEYDPVARIYFENPRPDTQPEQQFQVQMHEAGGVWEDVETHPTLEAAIAACQSEHMTLRVVQVLYVPTAAKGGE